MVIKEILDHLKGKGVTHWPVPIPESRALPGVLFSGRPCSRSRPNQMLSYRCMARIGWLLAQDVPEQGAGENANLVARIAWWTIAGREWLICPASAREQSIGPSEEGPYSLVCANYAELGAQAWY